MELIADNIMREDLVPVN